MSEGEGPESEVGGSVRDSSQTVLDGVDGLVDEYLSKFKLLSMSLFLVPHFAILGASMHHLSVSPHHLGYLLAPSLTLQRERERETQLAGPFWGGAAHSHPPLVLKLEVERFDEEHDRH